MKHLIGMAACAAAMSLSAFGVAASAQNYPSRPIQLILPYASGGPTDTQARLIGQKASEILKQPIIVENRPGAAGNIGANVVAKAKPDGYTLLFSSTGPIVINPHILKMPYDALKDLAPIALITYAPTVLAVNPNFPASTIREFIQEVKANSDKYSYASGGEGTTQHLSGELLKSMADIKMTHIPYKGEGPSTIDALGGHVPIIFSSVGTGLPNFKLNRLRPLAVTSTERNPALPDVPTLAESGFPGYEVVSLQGLFAPAGTPLEIIEKLNTAFRDAIASPDVKEQLTSIGNVPGEGTASQFSEFLQKDTQHWGRLVKQAGIKPAE